MPYNPQIVRDTFKEDEGPTPLYTRTPLYPSEKGAGKPNRSSQKHALYPFAKQRNAPQKNDGWRDADAAPAPQNDHSRSPLLCHSSGGGPLGTPFRSREARKLSGPSSSSSAPHHHSPSDDTGAVPHTQRGRGDADNDAHWRKGSLEARPPSETSGPVKKNQYRIIPGDSTWYSSSQEEKPHAGVKVNIPDPTSSRKTSSHPPQPSPQPHHHPSNGPYQRMPSTGEEHQTSRQVASGARPRQGSSASSSQSRAAPREANQLRVKQPCSATHPSARHSVSASNSPTSSLFDRQSSSLPSQPPLAPRMPSTRKGADRRDQVSTGSSRKKVDFPQAVSQHLWTRGGSSRARGRGGKDGGVAAAPATQQQEELSTSTTSARDRCHNCPNSDASARHYGLTRDSSGRPLKQPPLSMNSALSNRASHEGEYDYTPSRSSNGTSGHSPARFRGGSAPTETRSSRARASSASARRHGAGRCVCCPDLHHSEEEDSSSEKVHTSKSNKGVKLTIPPKQAKMNCSARRRRSGSAEEMTKKTTASRRSTKSQQQQNVIQGYQGKPHRHHRRTSSTESSSTSSSSSNASFRLSSSSSSSYREIDESISDTISSTSTVSTSPPRRQKKTKHSKTVQQAPETSRKKVKTKKRRSSKLGDTTSTCTASSEENSPTVQQNHCHSNTSGGPHCDTVLSSSHKRSSHSDTRRPSTGTKKCIQRRTPSSSSSSSSFSASTSCSTSDTATSFDSEKREKKIKLTTVKKGREYKTRKQTRELKSTQQEKRKRRSSPSTTSSSSMVSSSAESRERSSSQSPSVSFCDTKDRHSAENKKQESRSRQKNFDTSHEHAQEQHCHTEAASFTSRDRCNRLHDVKLKEVLYDDEAEGLIHASLDRDEATAARVAELIHLSDKEALFLVSEILRVYSFDHHYPYRESALAIGITERRISDMLRWQPPPPKLSLVDATVDEDGLASTSKEMTKNSQHCDPMKQSSDRWSFRWEEERYLLSDEQLREKKAEQRKRSADYATYSGYTLSEKRLLVQTHRLATTAMSTKREELKNMYDLLLEQLRHVQRAKQQRQDDRDPSTQDLNNSKSSLAGQRGSRTTQGSSVVAKALRQVEKFTERLYTPVPDVELQKKIHQLYWRCKKYGLEALLQAHLHVGAIPRLLDADQPCLNSILAKKVPSGCPASVGLTDSAVNCNASAAATAIQAVQDVLVYGCLNAMRFYALEGQQQYAALHHPPFARSAHQRVESRKKTTNMQTHPSKKQKKNMNDATDDVDSQDNSNGMNGAEAATSSLSSSKDTEEEDAVVNEAAALQALRQRPCKICIGLRLTYNSHAPQQIPNIFFPLLDGAFLAGVPSAAAAGVHFIFLRTAFWVQLVRERRRSRDATEETALERLFTSHPEAIRFRLLVKRSAEAEEDFPDGVEGDASSRARHSAEGFIEEEWIDHVGCSSVSRRPSTSAHTQRSPSASHREEEEFRADEGCRSRAGRRAASLPGRKQIDWHLTLCDGDGNEWFPRECFPPLGDLVTNHLVVLFTTNPNSKNTSRVSSSSGQDAYLGERRGRGGMSLDRDDAPFVSVQRTCSTSNAALQTSRRSVSPQLPVFLLQCGPSQAHTANNPSTARGGGLHFTSLCPTKDPTLSLVYPGSVAALVDEETQGETRCFQGRAIREECYEDLRDTFGFYDVVEAARDAVEFVGARFLSNQGRSRLYI